VKNVVIYYFTFSCYRDGTLARIRALELGDFVYILLGGFVGLAGFLVIFIFQVIEEFKIRVAFVLVHNVIHLEGGFLFVK